MRVGLAAVLAVVVAMLAVASPAIAPAAAATPIALEAELRARAITDRDFVRTELWTWTSHEQARALARGRPLLWAGAGDGALRAPYQRALDALGDHPLARALSSMPRRYAWTTPYGTAIALGARSYGPALVRITIADDAWHVRFAPDEDPPLRVVDGAGRAIALGSALAAPERIATVYHVRPRATSGPFREIVIVGGVVSWSIDPGEIRARIARERRVLAALRRASIAPPRSLVPAWSAPIADDPWTLFAQTMPFDTPRHRPTPAPIADLARALVDR